MEEKPNEDAETRDESEDNDEQREKSEYEQREKDEYKWREKSEYEQREKDEYAERDPGSTFDVSKSVNAPRKTHGTRVAFTFVCAGCGAESTLDYKPKGVPVEHLLCEDCMSSADKAGRWKLIRTKKEWEERKRTFELVCTECGNIEYSNRPPRKGRDHVCERCLMEQAQPDKSRLAGAHRVEGGVMVRRKKKHTSEEE